MGPGIAANASQLSYSNSYSRYESQTYQRLEQPPTTKGAQQTESSKDAEAASSAAQKFNVDALVDRIWSFASERIAQAKSEGASDEELDAMWEAAKSGVKQGFSDAKEVLSDLGEMNENLTLKIDSAYGQLMDRLDERNLTPTDPAVAGKSDSPANRKASSESAVNRMIQIEQYERQTFSLDLKTAEGDTINIRAVNESAATLDDRRFGRESSTQWSSTENNGYSLMIKGDLNEQEAEDLDKLLAEVNELAEEFYEGDYQTAFNMAQELNINGTSLQSMNLSMQEVEQKAAGVYAETAGQVSKLPKGLEPLKDYAEKLMQSQEKWEQRFNSAQDFLKTLSNHPMNRGEMAQTAKLLMW